MKTELILCQCHTPEHHIMVVYDEEENEVIMEVHLTRLPLHKRIIRGIKYIFDYRSRFGEYEEIIFCPKDWHLFQRMADALRKSDKEGQQ